VDYFEPHVAQAGQDDLGQAHQVDDPLAAQMAGALAPATTAQERVAAMLAFDAVVPTALATSEPLRVALCRWLTLLEAEGARGALKAFCER
jgi:fructuronate reductase